MPAAKCILVTGGAGFIGSHLLRHLLSTYPQQQFVNLDKLTYSGNLENLRDCQKAKNYRFIQADIADAQQLQEIFSQLQPDSVIHLAAESHVDRSLSNPMDFVQTNVIGTLNLLNAARTQWLGQEAKHRFYHISTDEVYGSLQVGEPAFTEQTAYDPHSPYAASKAAADHFVRAYSDSYGMDCVLSNCSNNYGPFQYPEKLIPLAIHNIQHNLPVPVYGAGDQIRDWLWVGDHVRAIDLVFHQGKKGATYNIGGNNEWRNIDLLQLLCRMMEEKLGRPPGTCQQLLTHVTDRAAHDTRYAINTSKIKQELNWQPLMSFEEGLSQTIDWYLANEAWLKHSTSGSYQDYYKKQYQ